MPFPDTLIDGDFTMAQPVGAPRWEYPFLENGDRVTALFEQDYWKTCDVIVTFDRFGKLDRVPVYTPDELSTPHPNMGGFYFIAETKPVYVGGGNVFKFTRTFSRIPSQQTVYSTMSFNKPDLVTLGTSKGTLTDYTSSYAGSALGKAYAYGGVLFGNNKVYQRIAGSSAITAASGGTFTITYNGSTTAALNYNANSATIAAALNGLASSIAEGLTWTHLNNQMDSTGVFQLRLTVGATAVLATINGASLTPAAATAIFGALVNSQDQYFSHANYVSATAHGIADSGTLCVNTTTGDTAQALLSNPTQWSVKDANTVLVSPLFSTPSFIGKSTRDYSSGPARIGTKKLSTFYLPGWSTGITTPADIPMPAALLNDATFLAAVISTLTGYLNYDADDLLQWRGSPIYEIDTVQINMANV